MIRRKKTMNLELETLGKEECGEPKAFNLEHAHELDSHVHFFPEKHIYTFDNQLQISVSSLISECFPVFDCERKAERLSSPSHSKEQILEEWESQGKEARDTGTFMHQQIERKLLGLQEERSFSFQYNGAYVKCQKEIGISHELSVFDEFLQGECPLSYRTEWRICDEEHGVAGTIDYLATDAEGYFIMYDWKRSNKIGYEGVREFVVQRDNKFGRQALGRLSHLGDTAYMHYCLQQNLYRYILKRHYDIELAHMYLVVLHPANVNYHCVEVPPMDAETQILLEYALEKNSEQETLCL